MNAHYNILNLGAGVQSTTLYLMYLTGEILPQIDAAIFSDTEEEPEAVYSHLKWLQELGGPRIIVTGIGKLGDHLQRGMNSSGGRFASIPAFILDTSTGKVGKTLRQCTREYKIAPIEKAIRREVLGLAARKHIPRSTKITQSIGISVDEAGRAIRVQKRFDEKVRWGDARFPLIEKNMTRADCVRWLQNYGVPHEVPRSACVFCPYHDNAEWLRIKQNDPKGWARAVEIDLALRLPGNVVNRNLDQQLFVHRSCKPLSEVDLTAPADREHQTKFAEECEGACGN